MCVLSSHHRYNLFVHNSKSQKEMITRSLCLLRTQKNIRPFSKCHNGVLGLNFSSNFHYSAVLSKKNKAKGNKNKGNEQEDEEPRKAGEHKIEIDFQDVTNKYKQVIEKFSKSANEMIMGKSTPAIFDKLKVEKDNTAVPFSAVAHASLKGRNFAITVFDPADVSHVVNAVLGSDLNMNPQVDPQNKQNLKVPMPPPTTETKMAHAKDLKQSFEKFKNGSGKPNSSLALVRSEVRDKFQKHTKKKSLSDEEDRILKEAEKLHKQFTDKLVMSYKAAENAILK